MKIRNKQTLIGSILAAVSLATIFTVLHFVELTLHNEETIVDNRPLSLNARHIAQNPGFTVEETELPVDLHIHSHSHGHDHDDHSYNHSFESSHSFISEELSPGFKFTTMAIAWEEFSPEGTGIEMAARFKTDGKWSEWMLIDGEPDHSYHPNPNTNKRVGLATGNLSEAAQYKVMMYGDGETSPYIKSREITFLKTAELRAPEIPQAIFSAITGEEIEELDLADSNIIPRSFWGANEDYRFMIDNTKEPQLVELSDDFYEKYEDELQVDSVIEIDQNGDRYKWPLTYPEEVNKIIVHHTASMKNLDNPKQAIRDMYYYHSINRGWGDIGYNYLIDPQGRVYEGRYGGEGVIGAHAGPGNHGSIGIALLGNFEEQPVPEPALLSLSELIHQKSRIHGINVLGKSSFRGDFSHNIMGHRDVMSTACPGQNLYEQLATVRTLASSAFEEKPKFVKDYDFQDQSGHYFLKLKPDSRETIQMQLENIGTEDWNSETYLILYQNEDFEGAMDFPTREGTKLAMMNESSVKSGNTATFEFDIQSLRKGMSTTLEIVPKINGEHKLSDDLIKIPLTIEQPIFKYELLSEIDPPEMMRSGSNFSGSFTLKNVGNVSWDLVNQPLTLQGKSKGIIAETQAELVEPGEIASFTYGFEAPREAGTFNEEFVAFMEDAIWSPADEKLSFTTQVYERPYHADIFAKTPLNTVYTNEEINMTIQMRNIGSETWKKDDFKLLVFKDPSIKVSDLDISPSTIKIGETARATFKLKFGDALAGSSQTFYFQPKYKNFPLIQKPTRYDVSVQIKEEEETNIETTSSDESVKSSTPQLESGDIRVKISSFSGNPEITSSDGFKVYSGSSLLDNLDRNEVVKISRQNGKFKVETPNETFSKNQEIRLVPNGPGIMEITNFDHAPAWNQDLNDNLYRGILEVNYVDGELVVINELEIEYYLRGLAEVSNWEELEKIKAIIVAARSYATYYTTSDERKFPGKPYDLDDDPEVSQKYLGFGLEQRSPNIAKAVNATAGEVITYDGEVLKAPYFNQSDGTQTKSALEVWGWTHTPYLVSVDDSYCAADNFLGHGVGMSGCGAKEMALQGFDYKEILNHYYTNIQITKTK